MRIGHRIDFQIEEHMKKVGEVGPEFECIARMGRLAPGLWMKLATGSAVSPDTLLAAAERAWSLMKVH
jgi:hypothetical protein